MMRWSVSQSATWKCPLQWWFTHHAQVPPAQPDPLNRVRGRAEHVALETAYRSVTAADARRGATMAVYADAAGHALTDYWRGQNPHATDWDVLRAVEDVTAVLDSLPVPPPATIAGVEKRFVFTYGVDGFTVSFTVVIDLGMFIAPGAVQVRDWKHDTIGSPDASPQLALYDEAVRAGAFADNPFGPDPVTTVVVGLYSIRRNLERRATLTADRRAGLLHGLVADAAEAFDACADVREGRPVLDAFPPRPDPDLCGGCVFRSYCPATSAGTWPVRPGVDVPAVRADLARRWDKASPIG